MRGPWRVGAAALACFVLSACDESPTAGDGGIEYRVTELVVAESFPVQIGVTVEVSNTGSERAEVVFPDGCVVLLRAYAADGDAPVWDLAEDRACTMALVGLELDPGEVRVFQTGLISGWDILGEELPDGEYRITAYLRPDPGGATPEVEIVAGTVDLAVPRE